MSLYRSYTSEQTHFVTEFVANVLGTNQFDLDSALEQEVFQAISRLIELGGHDLGSLGNWEPDHNSNWGYKIPKLDLRLVTLRQKLRQESDIHLEPLWPDNKPFALCLTHDVDIVTKNLDWPEIPRPLLQTIGAKGSIRDIGFQSIVAIYRSGRRLLKSGVDELWHYEDWLKLEDSFGFKSTFFYFPTVVSKRHSYDCTYTFDDVIRFGGQKLAVKDMMREMEEAGWEIGLHGSIHSAVAPDLLREQRNQIEEAIGKEIYSTRQHYLRYDIKFTSRLQENAGFRVDSTLGFNRTIGFRTGTSFPHWTWDHQEGRKIAVLEIPQQIMDVSLFNKRALGYSEDIAIESCLELMNQVQSVGGCLTLSWHPNYLNIPHFWNVYKILLEEAKHRNAWAASARDIYEWWIGRSARINS